MRFLFFSILLFGLTSNGWSQKDTTQQVQLSLNGFVDAFFAHDFSQPRGNRQPFLFNHNRHGEVAINLALLQFGVKAENYRANLGLQTGTYAIDNYALEPPLFRGLFEANVGLRLSAKNDFWLDVGLLPSHMGFESAISLDNPTLTRSLMAENSPYYSMGAQLSRKLGKRFSAKLIIMNGWQNIAQNNERGVDGFSLGSQITYEHEEFVFNWSTFLGSLRALPVHSYFGYFSNVYLQKTVFETIELTAGFDYGVEEYEFVDTVSRWYAPIIIVRQNWNKSWATSARFEYYKDLDGVMTVPEMETVGVSCGIDFNPPQADALVRIEGRYFQNSSPIFSSRFGGDSDTNFTIIASLALRFGRTFSIE